ncbi:hypothetical protein CIRMBP1230_00586 [Enterococcus cecorum]|uniref:hypothetical protein n=1 Tax=Enterococcus cecorum TaxID=44008 RepID=UPI0022D8F084|nr:hypothetical protein [Enterococcus cecorum]CAI3268791.1 hypothetical protein CIRMBP1220_00197 [Enterococcus cecorum]CAI3273763.1 hypothetical protein CIRMBP1216_00315 [Enterococcus cecorum]CAI3288269.1 hypothetical protein CIRMBP1229_00403 [Enterococcus cecorum]CAI3291693.1 hypothetical protein CIRMBP1227_00471 [Enterococcus cecorum]CAI3292993.1 hypothetical protein CIRMBP1230_00586 [Enterococcus cecorum]
MLFDVENVREKLSDESRLEILESTPGYVSYHQSVPLDKQSESYVELMVVTNKEYANLAESDYNYWLLTLTQFGENKGTLAYGENWADDFEISNELTQLQMNSEVLEEVNVNYFLEQANRQLSTVNARSIINAILNLPIYDNKEENTIGQALTGVDLDLLSLEDYINKYPYHELEEIDWLQDKDLMNPKNMILFDPQCISDILCLSSNPVDIVEVLEDDSYFMSIEGRTFDFSGVDKHFGLNADSTRKGFQVATQFGESLQKSKTK